MPDTGKDSNLEDVLLRLAATHIRWGFGLMYGWIRNQGYTWNHKQVYRVYKRLELNLGPPEQPRSGTGHLMFSAIRTVETVGPSIDANEREADPR